MQDDELRRLGSAKTLDEAIAMFEREHGAIATADQLDEKSHRRYVIVTTYGLAEVQGGHTVRRIVLRHWRGITRYVMTGNASPLLRMKETTVHGHELECRPDIITKLVNSGEVWIAPPGSDVPLPWFPLDGQDQL